MSASLPIDLQIPEDKIADIKKPKLRTSPVGWTKAILEGKPYPLRAMFVNNNPMALWPDQSETRKALLALDLTGTHRHLSKRNKCFCRLRVARSNRN